METLGERIRKRRKQRGLTLEALAGDVLTKGMVSLIENNKANPSMDSLTYIAEQLQVDVAELLEEVSSEELRALLVEVEQLYYTDVAQVTDEHDRLLALVEPYLPKLNQGYEATRLLEIYARILRYEQKEGWEVYLNKAALLYEEMNIIERRAAIGLYRASIHMENKHYDQALATFEQERADIQSQNHYLNPMIQLDFNYVEAVLQFAVGNSEEAIKMMDKGIAYSREQQVFYRIDHLYRLATFYAIMTGNDEQFTYYIKKLQDYATFAEDPNTKLFVKYAEITVLNAKEQAYEKVIQLLEAYKEKYSIIRESKIYTTYYHLEKGKALYGLGRFEEAIENLQQVDIPSYFNHPFDLAILYAADAFLARCHMKQGNIGKAREHAQLAYDNIQPMPSLPPKDFILATYEEIHKAEG